MGPYRDSISLKKSPLLGSHTGSEAQLDLATVRYHALGAYAKSVYLVYLFVCTSRANFANFEREKNCVRPKRRTR